MKTKKKIVPEKNRTLTTKAKIIKKK